MSFTERAGLIPVLLLTGCASPSVVTGPPSGSVVDSYLSRSAADISAMQYRIHQSGPSALRPVSLSSSTHGSGLLSKRPTLGSDSGSMPFKPAISVGSTVGTGGFIRLGGAAPTLRAALRNIVPSDHTVTFEKSIKPDTPEFWTWVGNDRWPYVINKMLSEHKLKAEINEKLKTVSVTPLQVSESGTVTPQSVPVPPSNINVNKPAGAAATSDSAGISKGRNPFRGDNTTTATVSLKAALPHALTPIPIAKPITVKHWRIEAGNTLRDWLSSQAAAEPCASPGIPHWTLAWVTPTNYRVDAPLNFEGNFREMLDRLFTLYGTAKIPLYAGVRSSQCVISVDDKEVR